MIRIPAFKAHLHIEVLAGEGVIVLAEEKLHILRGTGYEKVVPLIDGLRSTDDIVDALNGSVEAARVYYVMTLLETKGHIGEAAPEIAPAVAAFWHAAGIDAVVATRLLSNKFVSVRTLGSADSSALLRTLRDMSVAVATSEPADLLVVLTDDYLHPDLADINQLALAQSRPWLLVRSTGPELWLGPLFTPGHGACWHCLQQRLQRNRHGHRFVAERHHDSSTYPSTALGALPSAQAAACEMAAVATLQFLAGAAHGLTDRMLSLRWNGMETATHTLVRRPHCPCCGTAEMPPLQPLRLKSGKAGFTHDGGHRSVTPETTLNKYAHLVSSITGAVKMLEAVTSDNDIAHVYIAGSNHASKMDRLHHLMQGLRNFSGGKGVSKMQAKCSALCEALERYSGEYTGSERRQERAFQDWPAGDAIHPRELMFCSDRQYAERDLWNKKESRFNFVPAALDDSAVVDWSPIWSLSEQRHKFIPTQYLYYRAPARDGDWTSYCLGCSNGNASGNTIEEAILQGFFELVERDAVALWWYNRLRRPGVDLQAFNEPYLALIKEHYASKYRRKVWALDLTFDLGIPVFIAISAEADGGRILFGFGCHFDGRIALQRAFAEMNQMVVSFNSIEANDDGHDAELGAWLRDATLENQAYLRPDADLPHKRLADYPVQHSGEFLADIEHCRSLIEAQGMEMLVLDQTRTDVGLPVVKVVVPGLRHFWARHAPGRLYDVPVKLGLLSRPLREDELNPIPIFI